MGSERRIAGLSKLPIRCVLASALTASLPGCATFGTSRIPFLGSFWDHGSEVEVYPGGDSYAQQMNEARAKAAAKQTQSGSAPALEPPDTKKSDDKTPRLTTARARDDENAIRVTLGRPESLPVVGAPLSDSPPDRAIASAASPGGWKKEGERLAQSDPREVDDRASEPLSEPRELARSTVAPRKRKRPATSEKSLVAENRPDVDQVQEILNRAKAKLRTIETYQVTMTRVERVNGKLQPEEEVLLSVRRQPQAVRLQWDNGPSKGREVIYSAAVDDKVIHVNMANAAIPLPRMSIAVDSPLIMKNSRHSIKEAGFDTILSHMSDGAIKGDRTGASGGKVTYEGVIRSEGENRPCHRFVRVAPNGEKWEVLLDTRTLLPRSVLAHDSRGELLEKYTYGDVKQNPVELASANAFDPDSRWGKPAGLFSRLAGAAAKGAAGGSSAADTTTR
jgi:hypothetical protein